MTDTPYSVRFATFELDVRSRELRKGARSIRLQDQPFAILHLLLEHRGRLVTRDELCRRLWPHGTFVDFEHSLNAAVKRLRAALGDDADEPRFIETLPRRGYRFIVDGIERAEVHREAGAAPEPVRVAVLPFTNLTNDRAEEPFADGLTEETIAQLSALCRGHVGVIARSSSMAFKGGLHRARHVGRELAASFLIEGSVRRNADRVRITARLVAAFEETHVWSETYERPGTDALTLQTDIATRIATSLKAELGRAGAGP